MQKLYKNLISDFVLGTFILLFSKTQIPTNFTARSCETSLPYFNLKDILRVVYFPAELEFCEPFQIKVSLLVSSSHPSTWKWSEYSWQVLLQLLLFDSLLSFLQCSKARPILRADPEHVYFALQVLHHYAYCQGII